MIIRLNCQSLPLGVRDPAFIESSNEGRRFVVNARLRDPTASIFVAGTHSSSDVHSFLGVGIVSAAARETGAEYAAQGEQ